MPPINLFIFPIMGGYYILIRSELFRYRQQRLESQKLIFNALLAGTFLIICSWIVGKLVSRFAPEALACLKSYYPVKEKYFGTFVGSFISAIAMTEITNWIVKKDIQVSKAIAANGNEFERLCESCYRNLDLIQVTLKNDKCYVGLLKALPIPSRSSYITILPAYSGYRDRTTKRLVFTTQYLDVYASYVMEGKLNIREMTTLVIKIEEVISATRFDIEMYNRFIEIQEDSPKPPTSSA
jgi:hypothetical protein